ncbi:zinc finger protein GLIS2 [Microdochium nivale]|nr:zinc finger protein GLIS2 [Microdochium nivale]
MVLLSEDSSDISSLSSDDSPEPENEHEHEHEHENEFEDTEIVEETEPQRLPPAKKQRLGTTSRASSAIHVEADADSDRDENDLDGDISSDTSGDIPNSPINAKLDEEEFHEQVTMCAWDGCGAGDLGNMDRLVEHIHNDHIESRQKRYTCEWVGCPRKSMPHASGYALKAHMRSHTREKPFYCYLPECDRAFTRSDALAKHMRTVHETEALRPSDPVPKSMQHSNSSGGKGSKQFKIILKTPSSHLGGGSGHGDDSVDDTDGGDDAVGADFFTPLTEQQGFTQKELGMDLESLWKLCVANVKWGTADGETLRKQCKELEEEYRSEWLEKEVVLDQATQVEEDWWQRRRAVLAAEAKAQELSNINSIGIATAKRAMESEVEAEMSDAPQMAKRSRSVENDEAMAT